MAEEEKEPLEEEEEPEEKGEQEGLEGQQETDDQQEHEEQESQEAQSVPEEVTQEEIHSPVDGQPESILGAQTLEFLFDLDLPVSVELARKKMQIQEILGLGEGSIIEFDKLAGENVEVMVNDKKIAEGEVVVIEEKFGVRILSLINPSERLKGIAEQAQA